MAWNGSSSKQEPVKPALARKPPKSSRGLLAGVIVVALAAAVWLVIGTRDKPKPVKVKEPVKKVIADKGADAVKPKPVEVKKPKETAPAKPAEKPYYDTNKWHVVNGCLVPKGARLVNNYLTNKVERVFKYSTDTVILSYLMPPQDGVMPPPHPIMPSSEKTFLKSLNEPIVILDTDSEEVKKQKEQVIIARAQIKERMDKGETFEEILTDNYRLMSENNKVRREAQREYDKIFKSGDAEGARKYQIAIDAALSQMGIDPLDDPNRKQLRKQRKQQNEQPLP